jgi:DNA topoisomerase-1
MLRLKIDKQDYQFFGSINGSNTNKWHRVAKLAYRLTELDAKLKAMAERGNFNTVNARCAIAVRLLLKTGIRVGNESSAEGYMTKPHPNDTTRKPEFVQTFGLTTLLAEHVVFDFGNQKVSLCFTGKRSIENSFTIKDASLIYSLQNVMLNNVDSNEEGTLLRITYNELVKFIRRYVGKQFSPKDFRTLRANMYAWEYYYELPWAETKMELRTQIKEICEHVSGKLSNTPAVCKRSYIDDGLFEYMAENL